ncbi:MAG: peptide ABC transporter substrate-binding protein [Myxococcaceae bacterium]|nr:peptide ABC transporter substrate-binding protein [Myxococcaceae bacterium]
MRAALVLLLVGSCLAFAGGRARAGGTLEAAAVVKTAHADPLLADTPIEATLSQLTKLPPCRLGELSRPAPRVVRLTLRASAAASDVVSSLLRVRDTASPYRALLAPLRSATATSATTVDLELDGPAPDFEAVLCHPVLAVTPSFFAPMSDRLVTNADPALPRAWVDGLTIRATDARTAERLVAQRKAQVLLGGEAGEGALLYATWLVAHPRLGPAFAQALESTVDRPGLTRFFVRPPARPLSTLIPPAAEGPTRKSLLADVTWPTPARPAPLTTPIELTLVFDAALDEQRAVAERLQVKLGALGYRLKLEALPRKQVRERLAAGPELALVGALLPPQPAPALSVVLALAKEPSRLAELDGLGEVARAEAVAERASRPLANVFPLYVQGLGVTATREVQHLTRDAYGLPRLDDVFLAGE